MVTLVVVAALFLVPGLLPNRLRSLVGFGDDRILPPVVASTQGAYSFLATTGGGPVRWDPCRPVRYEVNPEGAEPAWVELVHAAAEEIEHLTGLRLEYAGESRRRPGWEADFVPVTFGSGAPALIAWATAEEVPRLAGDVAGLGGAAPRADQYGGESLSRGGITLDIDSFEAMAQRRDGRAAQRSVVLHEFGHLVGLGHVDDPEQLMYHGGTPALQFRDGDRAGLAAAGQGPCR
ncbi:matrixin family metalloprotease [Nocardioides panacisoli]|uniref:matrixin family metalloprotease n=1 Tax=Nocardioides panacisoli TaxID=627624 RepID=UPI001C6252A3|nr:matrixin family metalloprotease [Nocardioides panacisoli]QYJ05527.1 matrixin family metalloprotease [Nocardioides panacisoli]